MRLKGRSMTARGAGLVPPGTRTTWRFCVTTSDDGIKFGGVPNVPLAAHRRVEYAPLGFPSAEVLRGIESMRIRNLLVCTAIFTAAFFTAGPSFAQARGQGRGQAKAEAKAEDKTDPRTARFGVWDNSTNPNNVMTYEVFDKGGSKLTVSNPSNPASDWSYVTLFDGVFRPVTGQQGAETAVEIINPKSIRIYNKRDGVLTQVVINTLSDDNNTISNEYIRMDKDGKITGVTHVTYIRRKK